MGEQTSLVGGEGSRGGNVIGHTSTGAPIYAAEDNRAAQTRAKANEAVAVNHDQQQALHKRAHGVHAAAGRTEAADAHKRAYAAHQLAAHATRHWVPHAKQLSDAASQASTAANVHKSEQTNMEKGFAQKVIGQTADGQKVFALAQPAKPPAKPGAAKPAAKPAGPPAAKATPAAAAKPAAGKPGAGKPGAEEAEDGPGSHDYHRNQALAHLQAAQAHAGAASSAKKVAEAKEHKGTVEAAERASAATQATATPMAKSQQPEMFIKNNLQMNLSAEDEVLSLLNGGSPIGRQAAAFALDGRPGLLGMRGERLQKSGTMYQGEHEAFGSRGGDMREAVARAQELEEMVQLDDPERTQGEGGLKEWFTDAYDPTSGDQVIPLDMGPAFLAKSNDTITVLDDSDPVVRAGLMNHQADNQAGIRMAYQGRARDNLR